MANGKIKADTLEHSTAGSLDTSYVVNGSAKVWCAFDGTGTIAIRDSFNTASITDNNTGIHTVNYTSALVNAEYAVTVSHYESQAQASYNAQATSSVRVDNRKDDGTFVDVSRNTAVSNGDLA
jgi:hypothetical protein